MKTKDGPIIFNDIYDGEIYDARLEEEGWDVALYDDSAWEFAQEVVSPQGKMKSQATFPFIKVDKILPPKELTSPTRDLYLILVKTSAVGCD